MPLSKDEEREVLSRVRKLILEDFHEDFQEIYSYAVTTLEIAPEQANNEIRNALNHIARALTADDMAHAEDNLSQARGHIERAKRDCLKLALIHIHEQLRSDLLSIEIVEGAVPMSKRTRLKSLENSAKQARMAESDGEANVTNMMADVFADMKTFRDDIHAQFTVPSGQRTFIQRLIFKIRHNLGVFISGVLVAALGEYLFSFLADLLRHHH
jgi:hypothetical protein